MRRFGIVAIGVVFVAIVGLAINAFAHGGRGWGGGWAHHGQGCYYRGNAGPGYDPQMSKEEYAQLEEKKHEFFNTTKELRAELFDKQDKLQAELDKDSPDVAAASALQKEISALRSQLDQKRIQHVIEMREINPNAGRGYMRGCSYRHGAPMKGYGPHGPRGGGNCWRQGEN
jgi:Spy/CpxP family protein refolding chaperone